MRLNKLRENKIVSMLLVWLTPVMSLVLMEGITGNLLTLSKSGFFLDLLISYGILVLLIFIFQKLNTAAFCQMVILIALALVQYYVYRFRGRSFTLSDLRVMKTATEVAGDYSYIPELRVGLCLAGVLIWLILLKTARSVRFRRFRLIRIATAVMICVGSFSCLSNKDLVAKHASLKLEMWNIDKEYRHKGMLLMLASEVQYLSVAKPENYSVKAVQEIAKDHAENYQKNVETNMESEQISPKNLIIIMNESLADLRILNACEEQMDVMDNIDNLTSKKGSVYKGYLQVPVFGGGTANTEYEVLTGNSMAFWDNWTIAYQVYSQAKEYGMPEILKQQGYDTVAMHPQNPLNYNRKEVYTAMDFNEFISRDEWDENYKQKIRKHISDESCYEYVEQLVKEKDSENLFAFLVTMQNHSPYQSKKYEPTVSLEMDQAYPQAEEYLSLVKESDDAFGNLISYFEEEKEPTMIVMFGDHLPNILDGFYDELAQKTDLSVEEFNRRKYRTPYIIWTNYKTEMSYIPLMSANYFGNYIMDSIGVRLSDYDRMSLNVLKQIPVIDQNEIMTTDGTWISKEALSEEQKKLLNDYEIMQYNEVFGNRNRVDEVFQAR